MFGEGTGKEHGRQLPPGVGNPPRKSLWNETEKKMEPKMEE